MVSFQTHQCRTCADVLTDDGRVAILTNDTINKIASMLGDPNEDVRKSTLQTIAALVHYSEPSGV